MSTILDALRKLQRERAAESPSRDLRGSITTETPKALPRKRGGRMGWIAALLLLSTLGGGVWFYQRGPIATWMAGATGSGMETGGASEAELAEAESEVAALAVEPETAPLGAGSAVALPTPRRVETSEAAVERARLEAALANARAAQEDAAAAELEASRQEEQAAQAEQAARVAQVAPTPPITPAPVTTAAASAAKPAAPPEPKPVAKLTKPKPATRAAAASKQRVEPERASPPTSSAFPDVRVESIRWHPIPERRVASLHFEQQDAPEAREGDIVAGVLIYRIDPGAVELHIGSAQRVVSPEP